MCGRMEVNEHGPTAQALERWFATFAIRLETNRDLRPTEWVPVIRIEDGTRVFRSLRWGLIPSWAPDPSIASRLFNARSETAAEKRSFREALRFRRCVVLCDAFYEWAGPKGRREKLRISMGDGGPVRLAGLWERWMPRSGGAPIETCTVLTCAANTLLAPVHDRMPVILTADAVARWLEPSRVDASSVRALLTAATPGAMHLESTSVPIIAPPTGFRKDCGGPG